MASFSAVSAYFRANPSPLLLSVLSTFFKRQHREKQIHLRTLVNIATDVQVTQVVEAEFANLLRFPLLFCHNMTLLLLL